jgi:4-diphosphocytidyl-2-C-methyl-D-erythritol kinase
MANRTLTYRAYGKVNLYLDILDRRPDGFTNIETIFQSVGLADTLTFTSATDGITCTCDNNDVPTDERNLAVKAAHLLQRDTGTKQGALINIEKHIPVAGGMAGGSCNSAAALVGLNELWALGLGDEHLNKLALELGSDVPFCLRGGTAAATGRGEAFHPMPPLPETWLVLLFPGIPISAGALYNHPCIERSLEEPVAGFTPAFTRALRECSVGNLRQVVFNRFEAPAFIDHPDLVEAKEELLDAGCEAAAMSGSGSTLFGVCASKQEAEALALAGLRYPAVAVPTVNVGIERGEA